MKSKVSDLLNEMKKSEDNVSFYGIWKERNLVEGKLLKDVLKSYFYIYQMCSNVYELSRLDLFFDNINNEDLDRWEPLIKQMIYNHMKPSYDSFIKTKKATVLLQEILNNKEISNIKELDMLLPKIDKEKEKEKEIEGGVEENEIKDITVTNFYRYLDNIYTDEIGMSGLNNLNKLYNIENYNKIREYFDENSFELLLRLLKKGFNDNTIKEIVKNKMKKEKVLQLVESDLDIKIMELIIKENLPFEIVEELIKKSDFSLLLLKECIKYNVKLNELLNEVKNNKNVIEIYEKMTNQKFESYKVLDDKVKILNNKTTKSEKVEDGNNIKKVEIKSKGRKIDKNESKKEKSILESDIYKMKIKEYNIITSNHNNMLLSKEDFPVLPSESEIVNAYRQLKVKPDIIYSDLKKRLEDGEEIINKKGGAMTIDEEKYLEIINDKINMLNYITSTESDYKELRKEIDSDINLLKSYLKKNSLSLINNDVKKKISEYLHLVEGKKEKERHNNNNNNNNKEGEEEGENDDDSIMDPEHLRQNKEILSGKQLFNMDSKELNEQLKFGEGFGNDFEILKSDKYDKNLNNKNDIMSEVNPAVYSALQFLPRESKYSLDIEPTINKSYSNLLKSEISAIGRRKTSVAKVTLTPGEGIITVNNMSLIDYFKREYYRDEICLPFYITYTTGMFNVKCNVKGGGLTGQCDAIKLGISRCLQELESDLTPQLKMCKLLTRDPRMVERKKYGHKKARKSFQWNRR